MQVRRLLGAVLTVPVMITGLLLVTASPAAACSCMAATEPEHAANADVIFVGKLVDRADPPQAPQMSSAAPVTLTFEVSEVYKGSVSARQEVVTPMSSASCGLEFTGEGPFLGFGRIAGGEELVATDPGQYVSYLCDGSRALADGGEPQLGAFSEPQPPAAAGGGPGSEQSRPLTGADDSSSLSLTGAVVGGGLLLAAGAFMLRARRRSLPGRPGELPG